MSPWGLRKPQPVVAAKTTKPLGLTHLNGIQAAPAEPIQVSATTIATPDDLDIVLSEAPNTQPKIIKNLDIGDCTRLWKPQYLKSRTSLARTAVIHSAPTSVMNFTRRDTFSYNRLPFHAFLDLITSNSPDIQPHMYLRSISSESPNSKPANLATDWPEFASDFHLPLALSYMRQRYHSSSLRISTNLSMWLHYDVMANILFHVYSYPTSTPKRLILFPPSDLKHLAITTGSTTSTLDIFQELSKSSTSDPIYPPNTHPYTVTLNPGEALYIPPLWAHTAAASPPGIVNISVNVFFKSLPDSVYPAGRDVYGNRDLQPYEDGRRDIVKIVKRFKVASKPKVAEAVEFKEKDKKVEHWQEQEQKQKMPQEDEADDEDGLELQRVTTVLLNGQQKEEAAAAASAAMEAEMPKKNAGVPREIAKAYLERLARELLEEAEAL